MTIGMHFALTPDEVRRLRDCPDAESRIELVIEEFEEELVGTERAFGTDKAWYAIAECLCMDAEDTAPLQLVIYCGEDLGTDDDLLALVTPAQCLDVAEAMAAFGEDQFRANYGRLDPEEYPIKSDEDLEYTLENLRGLDEFFRGAGEAGRFVLFSVLG